VSGTENAKERIELAQNAAGRTVPTVANGQPQTPFAGVGKYQPRGRKAAPAISSNKDYPIAATSAWPIWRRRCASADFATAW